MKTATDDACDHGVNYDHDCPECDALIELARADGAETPREVGIWERAYDRATARAHTAADEFAAEYGHAHPWVAKIRALGDDHA